ncbi:MAG: MarR family transcriptional regulator [Hyphomicrobiales bacterium]
MLRGRYLMTEIPDAKTVREGSFGFLIQTLSRRLQLSMKQELAGQDVDAKIFANLMALRERDGINQRQLGEKLDFPEYYTSRNVDALVEAGFAERRPDPNSRRSHLIFLTAKGREKAECLPAVIKKVNDQFLDSLDDGKRKAMIKLLKEVVGID